MNKELKQRWIEALRFGRYEQGRYQLVSYADQSFKYCCLGVLCNIENIPIKPSNCNAKKMKDFFDSQLSIKTQSTLVKMNDIDKKSFEEIADYIEKNIPDSE